MARRIWTSAMATITLATLLSSSAIAAPAVKKIAESSTVTQGIEAQPGAKAPEFTLKDSNGKSRSLSDYAGKFVVLEWVNFGCPFVRKHYESKNMQQLQDNYCKKGVIWLSICSSADGKQGNMPGGEINSQLKAKGAKPTAYLIDNTGKVGKMYGAKATPHMFVIDKGGTLIYKGAIDDKASVDQADIAKSENYVKSALDSAMAGKQVATPSTRAYGCSVKYQQ